MLFSFVVLIFCLMLWNLRPFCNTQCLKYQRNIWFYSNQFQMDFTDGHPMILSICFTRKSFSIFFWFGNCFDQDLDFNTSWWNQQHSQNLLKHFLFCNIQPMGIGFIKSDSLTCKVLYNRLHINIWRLVNIMLLT